MHSGGHLFEVQVASNTVAILIGPSCNFPSDDLDTNLSIMFKIYQVPDQLTNSLATIHESAYSREIQILSSFMPSELDVVPKVLFTGKLPEPPNTNTYQPVCPSLLINCLQGFPMRHSLRERWEVIKSLSLLLQGREVLRIELGL